MPSKCAMTVPVKTEPPFNLETPPILFRGNHASARLGLPYYQPNPWDMSLGGKRFLMMKEVVSTAGVPRRLNIVANWTEELKQRAPIR